MTRQALIRQLSGHLPKQDRRVVYANNCAALVLALDVPVAMVTVFYRKGVKIESHRSIAANYLRRHFARDLLSILPLPLNSYIASNAVDSSSLLTCLLCTNVFFLFRISQFREIKQKFFESLYNSKLAYHVAQIVDLFVVVLLASHVFGCGWILIGQSEKRQNRQTMLESKLGPIESFGMQEYMHAIYFTVVTMATVGYGDIVPVTSEEIVFGIVTVFLACFMFAHLIGKIQLIFNEIQRENEEIQRITHRINTFMESKNIRRDLQYNIREYLYYNFKENRNDSETLLAKSFQLLSPPLKQQLMVDSYKFILEDSPIFRNNFSAKIKQKMVEIMQEMKFSPEQVIYNKGDAGDAIYFVERGSLESCWRTAHRSDAHSISHFTDGMCFGGNSASLLAGSNAMPFRGPPPHHRPDNRNRVLHERAKEEHRALQGVQLRHQDRPRRLPEPAAGLPLRLRKVLRHQGQHHLQQRNPQNRAPVQRLPELQPPIRALPLRALPSQPAQGTSPLAYCACPLAYRACPLVYRACPLVSC